MNGKTKRDLEIDLRASHQCVSMRVMPQPRMYMLSTPSDNDYLNYKMSFFLIDKGKTLLLPAFGYMRVEHMLVSIRVLDDLSASSLESCLESAQSGRVLENFPKRSSRWQPDLYMSFDFSEVFSQRSQYFVSWLDDAAESRLRSLRPDLATDLFSTS